MTTGDDPLDVLAHASLERIANAAAALLDIPLVLISVFDGPTQSCISSRGLTTGEPSPLCREVASSGKPIVMQDARRRLPAAARGAWQFDLVGYAGVALKLPGPTRIGALAALTPARRTWQSRDLHVLRSFAEAASAILTMHAGCEEVIGEERRGGKRRTLELEQTSVLDELTGLLNRRGLFAVARAQLDVIHTHSIGGLLLYVDLDNLKVTNDRHGHSAGDDLLRAAATVLRAAFRDSDTIARLGGDEFVVIATDTAREDHPAVLARLAAELGRVNELRAPASPLAWSLGLVSIEPAAIESLDSLMSAADRRMYAAKRTLHDLAIARRSPVA